MTKNVRWRKLFNLMMAVSLVLCGAIRHDILHFFAGLAHHPFLRLLLLRQLLGDMDDRVELRPAVETVIIPRMAVFLNRAGRPPGSNGVSADAEDFGGLCNAHKGPPVADEVFQNESPCRCHSHTETLPVIAERASEQSRGEDVEESEWRQSRRIW